MKSIKRIALLLAVALLAVGSAQAQFRFGVKVGANFNKLELDNPVNTLSSENGCGFTGGVMTEFTIPVVGICFDASLMYTRMNGESDVNDVEGISSSGKNFFEIPVNIKYKLSLPAVGNIVAPYIFTGPDFAFKLGGEDDVFKTKTFQCAWNIGLGVELINHLQISGSYAFGMNDIAGDVMGVNTTDDYKVKNNYWTLTAAWLF